jgi:hypothetical protein
LSLSALFALVLKVFRNRFRCHGQSLAELLLFNLSNFVHSLTIYRPPHKEMEFERICQPNVDELVLRVVSPSHARVGHLVYDRGWPLNLLERGLVDSHTTVVIPSRLCSSDRGCRRM